MSEPTEEKFVRALEDFGYKINNEGKLRKIDRSTGEPGDEPFEFEVSADPIYNQKHYEAVGEVVTQFVYQMLDEEGLQRLPVPPEADNGSFIFASDDFQGTDKLLLLIHGTGVVRAGQWARSLIINDCLDSGTQLPFIRKARELGYGVIVFNTNENYKVINAKKIPIPGSTTPQEHANTVWRNYILPAKANHIAIVAHSFGGIVTMSLASNFEEDFLKRVFAIALTDSIHGNIPRAVSSILADHLSKIGCNWVSSKESINSHLQEETGEIKCVSAGTSKHEMTSWSSFESVFSFIEERLASNQSCVPASQT